ncbi:MAG: ComEC/Rec2 family competence protein [Bacteroidales bacterium]|nr:ComEC/Rec2 family competence protein [Bacteroidales bacterium]
MNRWNQHSLFRLLVFFALGILLETGTRYQIHIIYWILPALILMLALVHLASLKHVAFRIRWLPGLLLGLIMFTFGIEWSRLNDQRSNPHHLSHHYSGTEPVLVRINGALEARPNSYKALAEIIAVETDSVWLKVNGDVLLYFPLDSIAESIAYGDRLLVYAKFNTPSPPSNPGEFDYQGYLANKNIHFQAYIRPDQWIKTGSGFGNPLVEFALSLRKTFIRVFNNHGIAGRDFSVATALILGMDDYLDNDTRKEFSTAGAMHVLCVSGLHVGVIFLVFSNMLFFLKRNRYSRFLRIILLLSGIWFYALLTGLAPSVLRATTMFSFVIIGMSMNRNANIYNSLAVSAFILLIINPYLIREVGFQLSYIAVIAIVSIQPGLYQLWRPRNWLLDKIWAITTVSIAAQIGTAPLGLYYFHQFPNYFIITNLLVIPLASLILYAGFLTVILSAVPVISGWISWLLVVFLKAMNNSVAFVDSLPYSATTGVFISMLEMLVLFLVIMVGFRAFAIRKAVLLQVSLSLIILFFGIGVYRQYERANQHFLVVYALRNDVAIDMVHGRNGLMLVDSTKLSDPSVLDFHVINHHTRCGIKPRLLAFDELHQEQPITQANLPFKARHPFVQFGKELIMLVDRNTPLIDKEQPLQASLLIVIDSHRQPKDILQSYKAGKVIISNKVPPWNTSLWREACTEMEVPYHDVREKGAFVLDI